MYRSTDQAYLDPIVGLLYYRDAGRLQEGDVDSLTGTTFGNYQVGEELRRETGNVAYLANEIRSGRIVRLNVLPLDLAEESTASDRFLQQATAAARLVNPGAATVYDAGIIEGQPFVVSQYIETAELSAMTHSDSWSTDRSIAVLEQVATVLDAAHQLGIIHGDIRPENLQLRSDDQPFVLGFGIPVDAVETGSISQQRAIWASPEQIEGKKPTAASDLYQLGLVAYYLLTGTAAFQRASVQETLDAHLRELPTPAHERNPDLSPQVSLVIQTVMARKPEDRYRSATAFVNQLASAIHQHDQEYVSLVVTNADPDSVTDSTVELFPKKQQQRRFEVAGTNERDDVGRSLTRMGLITGGCLMVLLAVLGAGFGATTAVELFSSEEKPTPTTPENIVIYATFTASPTMEPRPTRTFPPPAPTATSTPTPLPTATPTGGNSSAQSTLPPFSTAQSTASPDAQPTATLTQAPTRTSEPTPTPTVTQIPAPAAPQEAGIQYDRALNQWRNDEFSQGWIRPATSTLLIGVYGNSEGQTMQGWTAIDNWTDISVSADLRATTTGLDAVGCVALRHDTNQGEYQLCMSATGETSASYNFYSSSQGWQIVELLPPEERAETQPPQSWNTLKIIAKGDQFWFYANGKLLGFAEHDGRNAGSAAIQVTNWDSSDAEFEFRNLVVRSVN